MDSLNVGCRSSRSLRGWTVCIALVAPLRAWLPAMLIMGGVLSGLGTARTSLAQEPHDASTQASYLIESELVRFMLPDGAIAGSVVDAAGTTRTRIAREGEQWLLSLTVVDTRQPLLTGADMLKDLVDSRRAQLEGVGEVRIKPLGVLENPSGPFFAVGLEATLPGEGGTLRTTYGTMKLEASTFLLVQLDATGDGEIPDYDAFVAGIDISERMTERESLDESRQAGKRFLESIQSSTLGGVADVRPSVYRIYLPASSSESGQEEEVGYQRVTVREGQRGEMKRGLSRSAWRSNDEERGFVASVETRLLNSGAVIDSIELHFLSEDFETELLEIAAETEFNGTTSNSVTTLFRNGNRVTVQHEDTAAPAVRRDWNLGDRGGEGYYISRLLFLSLPKLIVETESVGGSAETEPLKFAFYAYDPTSRRLTTRTDAFSLSEDGVVVHTSRPTPESSPAVAELDSRGNVVRRVLASGVVFERTTPRELRDLWTMKGLPLRVDRNR